MDTIEMKLIERETCLPLDIIRYINEYVKYQQLNNDNIKEAVELWIRDKEECLILYGHISYWNTSQITVMCFNINNLILRSSKQILLRLLKYKPLIK